MKGLKETGWQQEGQLDATAAFLVSNDTSELGRGSRGEGGGLGGLYDEARTGLDDLPQVIITPPTPMRTGVTRMGKGRTLMGPREIPSAAPAGWVQK